MGRSAVKNLREILERIGSRREYLQEKFKIKEIGVFGSFARGEQEGKSDVDVLVDFTELPDVFDLLKLERSLTSILKRRTEVIRKPAVRKELRDKIFSEVVLI